jgi:DNA topoisomerase-3
VKIRRTCIFEFFKKGQNVKINSMDIKEGKTSPPKRYTSGSIIIAMENAGKLIEDEELREQIKGSGIGTSATRAEILKKLERIEYIKTNRKTQVLTPT